MGTYTNTTSKPQMMPTLDPPVLLHPGESVDYPDPEPVVDKEAADLLAKLAAPVDAPVVSAPVVEAASQPPVAPEPPVDPAQGA